MPAAELFEERLPPAPRSPLRLPLDGREGPSPAVMPADTVVPRRARGAAMAGRASRAPRASGAGLAWVWLAFPRIRFDFGWILNGFCLIWLSFTRI